MIAPLQSDVNVRSDKVTSGIADLSECLVHALSLFIASRKFLLCVRGSVLLLFEERARNVR